MPNPSDPQRPEASPRLDASFVLSAPAWNQGPPADRPEVALWGRSNVGKSSLLNRLVQRRGLAKVSATPGKTRLLNYFAIAQPRPWYLVDLPGYGYAKVSQTQRAEFDKMVWGYLERRTSLHLLLLLIDIRLEPQASDLAVIDRLGQQGIPFALVFTKADKLTAQHAKTARAVYADRLSAAWAELPPTYSTSAETGDGAAELLTYVLGTLV